MNLDKINIENIDPQGMAKAIYLLPEQIKEATRLALDFLLPKFYPRSVVIAGMGGSAIGGDLLRALLLYESPVPIFVCRERRLPAWVGLDTLVLAVSYSGNTSETLEAYNEAREKGALVIAYSTGGELARLAKENKGCHFLIPGGLAPRAAIGFSFIPLLVTLWRLGLIKPKTGELNEAGALLEKSRESWKEKVETQANAAKQCATTLHGYIPLIYGSNPGTEIVALRWKCQFNENSKIIAVSNTFPELCHNELVGWGGKGVLHNRLAVIMLREREDPPSYQRQIDLARCVLNKQAKLLREIWAEGHSQLSRIFYLLYFGDYVSLYLSWLLGENPTPVEVLEWLKEELAKP